MAEAVIGALRVILGADSAAFEKQMNDVSSKLQAFGAKLATIGAGLTAGITTPLVAFGKKAYDAFQESDKAIKAVEAALKSTGGTVGFTSENLQEMAAQLQKISTFDDDDILGNVTATLLRFGNISGDIFADAQKAVLDVSVAMKTDLASAATLVGKALNDPARGLTALRRAGISFTEAQTKVIEKLIATGRTAEAQKKILEGFATAFGGQAEALAATASGKWTQAMNAIGDAMEKVGEMIAPLIIPIADFIKSIAEAFTSLDPSIQKFIFYVGVAAAALGPLLVVLGAVVGAIGAIGAPIAVALIAVAAMIAIVAGIAGNFENLPPAAKSAFAAIGVSIDETTGKLKVFGTTWEEFKKGLSDTIGATFERDLKDIQGLGIGIQYLVTAAQLAWTIFKNDLAELSLTIQIWAVKAQIAFEELKTWIANFVAQIGPTLSGMWTAASTAVTQFFADAQVAVSQYFTELLAAFTAKIGEITAGIQGIGNTIAEFAKQLAATTFEALSFENIKNSFADFQAFIAGRITAITGSIGRLVGSFANLKTQAIASVSALYSGVRDWLQNKLTAVIEMVQRKIEALIDTFKNLYDKVVGRSYVPDMVKESVGWMEKMATQMPRLGEVAAAGVVGAFANMTVPPVDLTATASMRELPGEVARFEADGGAGGVAGGVYISDVTINTSEPNVHDSKDQIVGDFADAVSAALRRRV